MRIVGGSHRGVRLSSVGKGDIAAHLRPTTDRVRENIFNMLSGGRFGDPIDGGRVLDLFAGTGALGLEAISRGADHVTFVDDGRKAQTLIRQNISLLGRGEDCRLIGRDATRLPKCDAAPFDLVFLDPPYGKGLANKALKSALDGGWIATGAIIIVEESDLISPEPGTNLISEDVRRYGDTNVHIWRFAG